MSLPLPPVPKAVILIDDCEPLLARSSFLRCTVCGRTSTTANHGDQCLRGYLNPPGHETPRCLGMMLRNK